MKAAEVFLDACLMTAVCLKEQEQYDSASAQLERLLTDPRWQETKSQSIRYELGLLYGKQENWQLATTMFEAIPTFHDVPQRLAAIRTAPKPAAAKAVRSARYSHLVGYSSNGLDWAPVDRTRPRRCCPRTACPSRRARP